MDLLSRYRNLTVLVLVIFAQVILLGYQVKSSQDIRLIRVWAVTAVTPIAKVIETIRSGTVDSLGKYINLHNLADENKRLEAELRLALPSCPMLEEIRYWYEDGDDSLDTLAAERSPSEVAAILEGSEADSVRRMVAVEALVLQATQPQAAKPDPKKLAKAKEAKAFLEKVSESGPPLARLAAQVGRVFLTGRREDMHTFLEKLYGG